MLHLYICFRDVHTGTRYIKQCGLTISDRNWNIHELIPTRKQPGNLEQTLGSYLYIWVSTILSYATGFGVNRDQKETKLFLWKFRGKVDQGKKKIRAIFFN